MDYVLQDDAIKRLARALMDLQEREDTALPLLRRELEETEKGLKNIADAIQQGIITNTTKQRLEELEAKKSEIEVKILQTELQQTILTEEKIIFWINRFKGGDIADKAYQRVIIDIFVNAIYLYDDKIVLTYNCKSDSRTITLSDIESSDLPQNVPPTQHHPTKWGNVAFCQEIRRDSNPKGHRALRKPSWMVFSEMAQACRTGAGRWISRSERREIPPSPPHGTNANTCQWFIVGETFAFVFPLPENECKRR